MTESKRISETANVGNIKQVDKPTKMVKTFDFFVFGFFFLFSFRSLIIRPKSINDGNIKAKQKKNLINIMRFYFSGFSCFDRFSFGMEDSLPKTFGFIA